VLSPERQNLLTSILFLNLYTDVQTDGQHSRGNTVRCITCSRTVKTGDLLTSVYSRHVPKTQLRSAFQRTLNLQLWTWREQRY